MKINKFLTFLFIFYASCIPLYASGDSHVFCGGPSGGTFMFIAKGVSELLNAKNIKTTAVSTKGSIDNIRIVNNNAAEFAVAYSGDVYQAIRGELKGDGNKYGNINIAGFVYYAPVQIAVRKDSNIYSLKDLSGKKLGVGGAGSGSAVNAEMILDAAGVWNNVTKFYIGYKNALGAFDNGLIDAFWIYAGYPNETIEQAAAKGNIRLLDLNKDIINTKILSKLPFMKVSRIPVGTYKGITQEITTISGSAVIITNQNVPQKHVREMLEYIYSNDGIEYLAKIHSSASQMRNFDEIKRINMPLHPGAAAFWKKAAIAR